MKDIIVIDTSISTQNLGDEIICTSIQKNWKELFEKNYICRFPSHTPPFSLWQQLFCPSKVKLIRQADYKFLFGTNALYTNMFRPLPQWNINISNIGVLKDVILLGVGAGINSKTINFYTKLLYSRVLSKKYIHSVRDEYTKKMLEKLGYKAYNTGCPTLWGLTPEHCSRIPANKAKRVVFTLTGYHPDYENDKRMISILKDCYKELYFWPQTYDDLKYLKNFGETGIRVVAPNLKSYDAILNTDIDYVGNRLHGGIRALQHAKRSIIISIDYRARNMADNYSLPVLDRNEIAVKLRKLIENEKATYITGIDWGVIADWKAQFDV